MPQKRRSSLLEGAMAARKKTEEGAAITVGEVAKSPVQHRIDSQVEASKLVHRKQLMLDPEETAVWEGNPRRQDILNYESCKDLIEGLLAAGRQETPAICRKVKGKAYEYEVLVGSRRRWSINWLRKNGHPEFGFLVEIRDYNDQEAFVLCDTENKDREDISDYERAVSYKASLDRHFGGVQSQMAAALKKNESWVSRYLALANCPEWVLAAYPQWSDLKKHHVTAIMKLLGTATKDATLKAKVAELAAAHADRAQAGNKPMTSAEAYKLLIEEKAPKANKKAGVPAKSYGPSEKPHLVMTNANRHSLKVTIPRNSGATREELMAAFEALISDSFG